MSKAQSPIVGRWMIIGADPIIVEFASSLRRWAVPQSAKAYFSSLLDAAIAHVDVMLAITRQARDLPDARVERLLDWIEAEMLVTTGWRERRLIISQTGSITAFAQANVEK